MNSIINYVCKPLVLIGALNWGLIGAFNFNLVAVLFGAGMFSKIIYLIVGIAALCVIYSYTQVKSKSGRD